MVTLVAEYRTECRVRRGFDSVESAVSFARQNWKAMDKLFVTAIRTIDGNVLETVWRRPVARIESPLPVAMYGVNGKRYCVQRPASGKWEGWTFVKTGSVYHSQSNIASVRPDGVVVKGHPVLFQIMDNPGERALEYFRITGACAVCGLPLENPVSRQIGMGPVCRKRFLTGVYSG